MFYIFTLLSALVTFSFAYFIVSRHLTRDRLFVGPYIIHHSCLGVALIILGSFVVLEPVRVITMAIGTGIYLSHVGEEIYFIKTSFWRAPFIFITTGNNSEF